MAGRGVSMNVARGLAAQGVGGARAVAARGGGHTGMGPDDAEAGAHLPAALLDWQRCRNGGQIAANRVDERLHQRAR